VQIVWIGTFEAMSLTNSHSPRSIISSTTRTARASMSSISWLITRGVKPLATMLR